MLVVTYAAGRASHARQVQGDDPDKKGYPGPPGWGLGLRLTTKKKKKKNILLRNLKRRPRPTQGCRANDDDDDDDDDSLIQGGPLKSDCQLPT
jgi:hypothetical protein